eukprot:TRINITY_DN1496_c0_g1_i1.p1 TRINITY_DN1496_c0_g1~~TRINITY_DN1496_c0_g1_i1.p1  ORF type:complete len:220 (+),score=24.18 TRINITY_DN1496_c0_g1_i1:373-1032(+)
MNLCCVDTNYSSKQNPEKNKIHVWLIGSCLSTFISLVATHPLGVVRSRLAVQNYKNERYEGILHAFKMMLREEGFRSYYSGLSVSLLGVVPSTGLYWAIYDMCKDKYFNKENTRLKNLTLQQRKSLQFAIAFLSASMAITMTYPLELVARRLMTQGSANLEFGYTSPVQALRDIFKAGGWKALFRGLSLSILRVAPLMTLTTFTYETCKKLANLNYQSV